MFFYGIRCNKPLDISGSAVAEHITKAALYHISADKKTSNKAIYHFFKNKTNFYLFIRSEMINYD
ncbi:hypothetical protein B4107_2980 [Bacillus safensis]|nr:hypothetical protein B4107_2980 [Bacillus safensis]